MEVDLLDIESFNEDDYLWRYMDLHKFISFIDTHNLFFTRLDKLDDPLEGLTELAIVNLYTYHNGPKSIHEVNPSFSDSDKERIISEGNARKIYAQDQQIKSQTTQFVNCWFQSNRESMAMWKLYSNRDSIAIRYKAKELIKLIEASAINYTNSPFSIFIGGKVKYKNLWPFDYFSKVPTDVKYNALKKDVSYSHENEFRFIAVTSSSEQGKHENFQLPLGDIYADDLCVIANPYMEEWKYQNIHSILKKVRLDSKLKKSELLISRL